MNFLKTVFGLAILGAVAYGAYTTLTHKQQSLEAGSEAPPFVAGAGATAPPQITLGVPQPVSEADAAKMAPLGSPALSPTDLAPPAVSLHGGQVVNASVAPGQTPDGSPVRPASFGVPADGRTPLPSASFTPQGLNPPNGPNPAASAGPTADDYNPRMQAIQRQLATGQVKQAHRELTNLYRRTDLRPYQRSQVTDLLDQLAGHVIYSREHLLEPAYVVQPGDTLESIAASKNVPAQLLANINGIRDPNSLQPGQQLKVVEGPFNAIINMSDFELTLMVGGRYAGRFPIGIGPDCAQLPRSTTLLVSSKTTSPVYSGAGNEQILPGDPNNPLGKYQLILSEPNGAPTRISIHGTNNPANLHQVSDRGAVCMSDRDIRDIFAILSAGSVPPALGGQAASKVTIVR